MQHLLKVFFAVRNFDTDTIIDIGGLTPSIPTTSADLIAANSQYWSEQDTNGKPYLCTVKEMGNALIGHFNDGDPYQLTAQDFTVVDVVGGHPVAKPGGKGG